MQENNNKVERPEGQFVKRFKVVTDIQALPNSLDVATYVKLCDSGFVFYDSDKGRKPSLYIIEGDAEPETLPVFVDTKGKEVNIDDLKKQWEDDEFWRKELYKCKQSPLYYFTNYVSTNPKPSTKEVDTYLESIGMGATKDSGEPGEIVAEEVKRVREEYAATITLENLKNLKPVRDRIDGEYEQQTQEMLAKVVEKHKLSGKVESAIKDKIILDLLKSKPSEAKEELRYYIVERTGRWDKSLMRATDIDVLVRLWNTL